MSNSLVAANPTPEGNNRLMDKNAEQSATEAPAVTNEEVERLNRLHRMVTLANSALCWPMDEVRKILAPKEGTVVRVLGVNSGSGIWPVEMAREFPHAEVLGIDPDPQQPTDTPPNCRFEVLDLVKDDIAHLAGKFDVVSCSRSGGWVRYYKPFWARLASLVKPGGLLLYCTGEMLVYDENKNLMKPAEVGQEPGTGSWWARFGVELKKYGPLSRDIPTVGPNESILDWMHSDPRLGDVKENHVYLPIGWPGSDEDNLPNGKELGRLVGTSAIERGRYMAPVLLANGMPAELLETCMREYEADILEQRVKTYVRWHFFAARGSRQLI